MATARLRSSLIALTLALACAPEVTPDPPPAEDAIPSPALFTPRWAFEPWVSKDISNGPDMEAFLEGFRARDIPVGVAVLDSPWETHYNTFIPNEERYPGFEAMVRRWRDDGVRTVLWVTQMVNDQGLDLEPGGDTYVGPASNFNEGLANDYFVNGGKSYFWWKGTGAAVDFFDEEAVTWWHAQQDALLDMGIAGWKLDFGEQYITDEPIETDAGDKTLQEYSEKYYEDFLAYGQYKRGADELVTMVRPYDESYGFAPRFYARPEHAPVAWVGDQLRNWVGLVDALDHIFRSARAGYAMLGSDIGGYLDTDAGDAIPFDLEVFWRWTAVSAWMPFFQLHGRANLAPWTVDAEPALVDETVSAYRHAAQLHHALVPFHFSLVREAQRARGAMLHPVGDDVDAWQEDWRFFVGDAFLVASLTAPGGAREVALPEGRFVPWSDLGADAIVGPTSVPFSAAGAADLPVFVKEGALVPLALDRDDVIDGATAFDGLTVLAFPGETTTQFVLYDAADHTSTLTLRASSLELDGVEGLVRVRVRADADASVTHNGAAIETTFDAGRRALWLEIEATGADTLAF